MKTKLLLCFNFFIVNFFTTLAQTTAIPDASFEEALIYLGIDSDGEINGQVLNSDVENVTELVIDGWSFPIPFVYDLTGIEAFSNLEELTVNWTYIETLDVSQNSQLKILDCRANRLTAIDLSANLLLEELHIGNDLDVGPFNEIEIIDLSNNPNIHTFTAYNMIQLQEVNLNNGNNNPNMYINVDITPWPDHPDEILNTVCFKVDDVTAAQNNQFPYSEWEISHSLAAYNFSNNCNLSTNSPESFSVSIHPNPAKDVVVIDAAGTTMDKVVLYDTLGRKVLESASTNSINVSHLANGVYILKANFGRAVQTKKILVEK